MHLQMKAAQMLCSLMTVYKMRLLNVKTLLPFKLLIYTVWILFVHCMHINKSFQINTKEPLFKVLLVEGNVKCGLCQNEI
jgi:hypothetical protein